MKPETDPKLFGLMAEFESVDALFAATRRARLPHWAAPFRGRALTRRESRCRVRG